MRSAIAVAPHDTCGLCVQVCPALAMGNTVVLKPASYTRLSALLFAQICAEAG
jgi:aldehyde dehydrogenase (NAD+)